MWYEPLIWVANGALALVWLLADHLWAVLLTVLVGVLVWRAPVQQRLWAVGIGVLMVIGGVVAPFPVALMSAGMVVIGMVVVRMEKINPPAVHWTMLRGLGLYALVGLGYAAWRGLVQPMMSSDPALQSGQVYLTAIASIALYLYPVGYAALLAQGLMAHPPVEGEADTLIFRYRSRGKP